MDAENVRVAAEAAHGLHLPDNPGSHGRIELGLVDDLDSQGVTVEGDGEINLGEISTAKEAADMVLAEDRGGSGAGGIHCLRREKDRRGMEGMRENGESILII